MQTEIRLFDDSAAFWERLGEVKLLSFEIEGGLLAGDFDDKKLLFDYLECAFHLPGFARMRAEAEALALRAKPDHPWSFSLEDVYQGLPVSCERELQILTESFMPQPHAKRLLDQAIAHGVTAVGNCEGPFSEAYWRAVLERLEIGGVSKIYTSLDTKTSKKYWAMFRNLKSAHEVEAETIFHFGADEYNDLRMPISQDMQGALVIKPREDLAKLSPLFGAVCKGLPVDADWRLALAAKAMERALLRKTPTGEEPLDPHVDLATCVLGPLLVGFFEWILTWANHRSITTCVMVAPRNSLIERLVPLLLRRNSATPLEVIVAPPSEMAEVTLTLRDLNVEAALVISCDPLGEGVGRAVARNPLLTVRPALHFSLHKSGRRSFRDVCFLANDDFPAEAVPLQKDIERLFALLVANGEDLHEAILPQIAYFIIEWTYLRRRYPELTLTREACLALIEVAAQSNAPAMGVANLTTA